MSRVRDVVVVGVGAMGAAACWRLARRGVGVLGLERFEVGHGLGSSGGRTRMIRLAYFEHPDYVPLLHRAYALWDDLGDASGFRALHRTGAVYVGLADGELVAGSTRAAVEHGLPHETLDRARLERRHPAFRVPEGHAALIEPEGGLLLADRAIVAMAAEARRHGAEIREGERVLGWSVDGTGVDVTTDRGAVRAERLILAAGASSSRP